MMFCIGGRSSGKSIRQFREWCERATELELQIDFAKKFDLPYETTQNELNKIYELLDGGRNYETSSKKDKKTKRRLL